MDTPKLIAKIQKIKRSYLKEYDNQITDLSPEEAMRFMVEDIIRVIREETK